ncbi:MAG: 16S rRNA processing protein RimM [Clostridia bacterium]|nr:16S rRNA processing protein RimM [Clostridia bacterium]
MINIKTQYLLIGEIIKPQGIKGELKLRAESEDMSRYGRLKEIYLKKEDRFEKRHVIKGRAAGGFAYLQIEGVSDRNAAEDMRGQMVYVERSDAIALESGKHFICDLIGCTAYDEHGNQIGVLRDVQQPNAYCDVYVFDTERGEMMMPALSRAICDVNVDQGKMVLKSDVLEEIALWPDSQEVHDD